MRRGDPLLRRPRRGEVRLDRLLPHAQASEDVGRHVQRVGRGGGNLRVGASRRQRQRSELGIIEGVDHVMGDPGVSRLQGEHAIEDLRGVLLPRIRLVGRRVVGDAQDRERVEDRRLVVARIAPRHACHGLFESDDARRVRGLRLVVGGDGVDEVALAIGRGADLLCLPRRLGPGGKLIVRRRPPDDVEIRHRQAPLRNAAGGVLREDVLEAARRLCIGEGVQHRQGALEGRLRLRLARGGEVDLPIILPAA